MDLRLTFNLDAAGYDRLRPTYTQALFDDVIAYAGLTSGMAALEIGIGTGQATLPFLHTGSRVTAIELGDRLAAFSRRKFASFDNFEVICADFENILLPEEAFDLVYSASAFHWIPQETGLPKVRSLLRPGGAFAWFSIQPTPAPEAMHIHTAVQQVYGRYGEFFGGGAPVIDPEQKRRQALQNLEKRGDAMIRYGFEDIQTHIYSGARRFSAQDYVALISTYSDHKAMPENKRIPFLAEIEAAIESCGGFFPLADTMSLCLGRKKQP